jgi:hypothetical protein
VQNSACRLAGAWNILSENGNILAKARAEGQKNSRQWVIDNSK